MRSRQRAIPRQQPGSGGRTGLPAVVRAAGDLGADDPVARLARLELVLAATGAGGFDWDLTTGTLDWDERACRIFGFRPGEFDRDRETFFGLVLAEDAERVAGAVARAVARTGDYSTRFRIRRRGDGALRRLAVCGRALPGPDGRAIRLVGVVRDLTGEEEALPPPHPALLPRALPSVPGVTVEVRRLPGGAPPPFAGGPGAPAERDVPTAPPMRRPSAVGPGPGAVHGGEDADGAGAGGDWCDVIPLPAGHVGLVVGSVGGRDRTASATLSQLRAALRAYAGEGHAARTVAARTSRFLAELDAGLVATCAYTDLDTATGVAEVVCAGHAAPLVRGPRGDCAPASVRPGAPLGTDPDPDYPVSRLELDPGAILLLSAGGSLGGGRGGPLRDGLAAWRPGGAQPGGLPPVDAPGARRRTSSPGASAPSGALPGGVPPGERPRGARAPEAPQPGESPRTRPGGLPSADIPPAGPLSGISLPADSLRDGPLTDGPLPAGSLPGGPVRDGPLRDGPVPDRSVPGGSLPADARSGEAPQAAGSLGELADGLVHRALAAGGARGDGVLLLARWEPPAEEALRRRLSRAVEPADLAAVSRVRRQLRSALRRWGVPEIADSAELLATELVTNALVHTDHGAVFTATLTTGEKPRPDAPRRPGSGAPGGSTLRVEVHDRASRRPQPRTPGGNASSGRGLLLVKALADDWGVRPRGEGKVTWFELRVPERPGGTATQEDSAP